MQKCYGFESRVAEWWAQTDPLNYGGPSTLLLIFLTDLFMQQACHIITRFFCLSLGVLNFQYVIYFVLCQNRNTSIKNSHLKVYFSTCLYPDASIHNICMLHCFTNLNDQDWRWENHELLILQNASTDVKLTNAATGPERTKNSF